MSNLNQNSNFQSDLGSLSVKELMELYDGTIDELQLCAELVPEPTSLSEDVDLREFALLDFESAILNQAASVQLQSKDDVLGLMDIWIKVADIRVGKSPNPSDRIAMNIFRHMNDSQFVKD